MLYYLELKFKALGNLSLRYECLTSVASLVHTLNSGIALRKFSGLCYGIHCHYVSGIFLLSNIFSREMQMLEIE